MSFKTNLLFMVLAATCFGIGGAADPSSSENTNTNTVSLLTFVITVVLAFFAGYLSVPDFSFKSAKSFNFLRTLGCLNGSPVSIKGHQTIKKTTFEIYSDTEANDGNSKWIVWTWIDAVVGFFKTDEEEGKVSTLTKIQQSLTPKETCFIWRWIDAFKGMFRSNKANKQTTPQEDNETEPNCKKEIAVTAIVSVICTTAVSVGLIFLWKHSDEVIQFGHKVIDSAWDLLKSLMETGNKIIAYISSKLGLGGN